MLKLYVGLDDREAVGLQVFMTTLLEHASGPVEVTVITPMIAAALGVGTDGTNAFTKSRFLVPMLAGYRGRALWMDGTDMMIRGDIHDLAKEVEWRAAVQVVKHDYKPKAARKYIGTEMEAPNVSYPRKNWSSVMAFACDSSACRKLTPEYVAKSPGQHLHQFKWVEEESRIGNLPKVWNWLDEYGYNEEAKLVHHTNGIPAFAHYNDAPHAEEWFAGLKRSQRGLLCA